MDLFALSLFFQRPFTMSKRARGLNEIRLKISCSFENLAVLYFTFSALQSLDKFFYEQQILAGT